jgi:hypothetical protein
MAFMKKSLVLAGMPMSLLPKGLLMMVMLLPRLIKLAKGRCLDFRVPMPMILLIR